MIVRLLLMDYQAITRQPGGYAMYAMYSKFVIGCLDDVIGVV